jgi:hypothetical protein
VRTRRGGSYLTLFIVDADGDLHVDGSTTLTGFDEYDDALALRTLEKGLQQKWDDTLRYNFDTLREMGVISGGDIDAPFLSMKKWNMLMMGAIGQLYDRCNKLERLLEGA